MKVICIDNQKQELPNAPKAKIVVGKTYKVTDTFEYGGLMWYVILSTGANWGWNVDCFIPCSNIDERKLTNKKYETTTI